MFDGLDDQQLVALLTRPAAVGEEHEVLWQMVGRWSISGVWWPTPNRELPVDGQLESRQLYDGLFVESVFHHGLGEGTRSWFGYDNTREVYFCVSLNSTRPHPDVLQGVYTTESRTLVLSMDEHNQHTGECIRVVQRFHFVDQDTMTMSLSYPDLAELGSFGMSLVFERSNAA